MSDLKDLLAPIKARTEKAANWRGDDFGHDCHMQLAAESAALQVAADDIAHLIRVVEVMEEALLFYACATEANNEFLGEPNEEAHLMPVKLGTRALKTINLAAEILREGE